MLPNLNQVVFNLEPISTLASEEWDLFKYNELMEWLATEVSDAYTDFMCETSEELLDLDEVYSVFYNGVLDNINAEIIFDQYFKT